MFRNNLFTGLLLGTLFALMFAPQKGKILRESMGKAHNKGENALEPLKRAVIVYFNEIAKQIDREVADINKEKEKNPFTITKI